MPQVHVQQRPQKISTPSLTSLCTVVISQVGTVYVKQNTLLIPIEQMLLNCEPNCQVPNHVIGYTTRDISIIAMLLQILHQSVSFFIFIYILPRTLNYRALSIQFFSSFIFSVFSQTLICININFVNEDKTANKKIKRAIAYYNIAYG